ncbi:GAF domain-containing protein [Geomicrobium sediminis]|uniref:RsbT co-antagonist protein RsbR n=1 Tax=Geomicrobium sediminis TaxID=1347788 RepID=A0ABS2PCM3_9BACL|nr:GAF domain-containing protein [Geomicrobium sediminis]MBM7633187.1 rsbT co-antagonist protein RsbR [Geomicrobium sediminis]
MIPNPHESLVDVSNQLFELIVDELEVNTAYVARRDDNVMTVLNSHNKTEEIVPSDVVVNYEDSNCKLVLENPDQVRSVSNLFTDVETKDRTVTEQFQVKAFLGVSLHRKNGKPFGTLCVMDRNEKAFSKEQVEFMKMVAGVLSYMIELDEAYEDMKLLSAPIIPVSNQLAVLALQGNINEKRELMIIEETLTYVAREKVQYIAIDLSQMNRTDQSFINLLERLVNALKLMGVQVMLSGVPISLAEHSYINNRLFELEVGYVQNLSDAFSNLGYELKKTIH